MCCVNKVNSWTHPVCISLPLSHSLTLLSLPSAAVVKFTPGYQQYLLMLDLSKHWHLWEMQLTVFSLRFVLAWSCVCVCVCVCVGWGKEDISKWVSEEVAVDNVAIVFCCTGLSARHAAVSTSKMGYYLRGLSWAVLVYLWYFHTSSSSGTSQGTCDKLIFLLSQFTICH